MKDPFWHQVVFQFICAAIAIVIAYAVQYVRAMKKDQHEGQ